MSSPLEVFFRMFVAGSALGTTAASLGRHTVAARGQTAPHVHEVRMVEVNGAYKFSPAALSVPRGDTVVFALVSGGPHDVAFDTTALPAASKQALGRLIRDPIAPFAGPLLVQQGARFVLATAALPPGTYPFYCLPHAALAMKGVLTVE